MPIKSRYPDRDFSHRPYLLWLKRVYAWLLTKVGESDYPAHEVGDLPVLIDALEAAINNWEALHGVANDRSKIYTDVTDLLKKQLQLLKQIIPTVIDPHVMGSFGLDKSLPDSRDELGGVAEICIMHWNEVIGGGVPPEYAPLEPQFNALITLFGDFEMVRTNYYNSYNIAQQAQDDVVAAREARHAKERDIFNWYNGFHPDSQAEWWTSTEWGTSSGGGGSGTSEEETPWGMVQRLEVVIDPIGNVLITWKKVAGAVKYNLLREIVQAGSPAPMLPFPAFVDGIPPMEENGSYTDTDNDPGFGNYYSVVADDGEGGLTEACEPVGIEIK
ncbi:hypothetical protein KAH81_04555 [bacterium]|nr:hypothetical protein [bacterium]